jgi:hypothetical protein
MRSLLAILTVTITDTKIVTEIAAIEVGIQNE